MSPARATARVARSTRAVCIFQSSFALEIAVKVTLPKRLVTPRNPFVAAARMRRAGSHRACARSVRQSERRAIARELNAMSRSP